MVIITSKYVKSLDGVGSRLDEHRKFLDEYYQKSKFLCCGAQSSGGGGVIIADVGLDEARTIMKNDPLSIDGSAEYDFFEFTPRQCDDRLSRQGWGRTFIFD
jgi:uncharacterized protein YciI